MWADLAGHVGYIFIALGLWQLTKKKQIGWLYRFIGETIWVILGFVLNLTSIWAWGIIFMLIDLKGFYADQDKQRKG